MLHKLNRYGIKSGWYMFELADKAGQEYLHAKYPKVIYWLTSAVEGGFLRQVSHKELLTTKVLEMYEFVPESRASRTVCVRALSQKTGQAVAEFELDYVPRDHLAIAPKTHFTRWRK